MPVVGPRKDRDVCVVGKDAILGFGDVRRHKTQQAAVTAESSILYDINSLNSIRHGFHFIWRRKKDMCDGPKACAFAWRS